MQDYIPCSEICLDILRPKDKHPSTIEAKLPVLSIATEKSLITLDYFYNLFLHIPFAKRNAQKLKQQYLSGEVLTPISFDDDENASKGIVHDFYLNSLGASDTLTVGGLLSTHQLLNTSKTEHGYVGIFFMARNDGKRYTYEEKQLFAYCFEIFLAELKHKIKNA
ncbi:hypothetical protein [Methylocucumis oryzae]|uniref:Uncharacterized protein n=1 Tax=Methylocucumis oryzae TaxID=1632867 RepID=A0A0F3IJC3_9GAMM|nr:hypothetical protein [Methylocucumis oryzae]KJV06870.1 hypothetical protein VZ94_08475 [Methylocucumis oryzae]